ncbi:MAG TPA: histidine phosphatase family protein [Spirochaetota bacterium]|nr:histidine phosphatase family protein [Spirochaetota bacterium]
MRLILVRHGETVWNRENRVQGRSDTLLSDNGIGQAERLAENMGCEQIDLIVTSPLRRAAETASIINRRINAPLELDADLKELDQGMFEGMSFGELARDHGDFLRKWAADPASVVIPGGESLAALQERAWRAVCRITVSCDNALVISHNFTITTILCKILHMPLSDFRRIRLDNASKTIVEAAESVFRAIVINDTAHLK